MLRTFEPFYSERHKTPLQFDNFHFSHNIFLLAGIPLVVLAWRAEAGVTPPQHCAVNLNFENISWSPTNQNPNSLVYLADNLIDIWDASNSLAVRWILLVHFFSSQDHLRRKISEDTFLHRSTGPWVAQVLVSKGNNLSTGSDLLVVRGRTVWSQKSIVQCCLDDGKFSVRTVLDKTWFKWSLIIDQGAISNQPYCALIVLWSVGWSLGIWEQVFGYHAPCRCSKIGKKDGHSKSEIVKEIENSFWQTLRITVVMSKPSALAFSNAGPSTLSNAQATNLLSFTLVITQ